MADKNNKVKYNLKNAHYALLTIAEDGTVSFGKPTAMPGAVSISLDANGEPENFYADGVAYYVINNNMGYDGDLELAMIPESFRLECLKEELDSNGVLIENSDVELGSFALLFEFDGDQKHIRHVLYNCAASRPGIEGQTNEDSKEVQTETLTITATPLGNGMVKAKTGNTTNATVYADWYKEVYLPSTESAEPATQAVTTAAKASTTTKATTAKEV
ncbi:MAG: phage tail protein [Hespellia sp.]|nr:phage tail protein [Hespellia sp.]